MDRIDLSVLGIERAPETLAEIEKHRLARAHFTARLAASKGFTRWFRSRVCNHTTLAPAIEDVLSRQEHGEAKDAESLLGGEFESVLGAECMAFIGGVVKLPWLYLGIDLATIIRADLFYRLTGFPCDVELPIPLVEPEVPALEPRPGEMGGETLARYQREIEAAWAAATLPRGYVPRDDREIRDRVEWLYRQRVEGESIRHIARYDEDGSLRDKELSRSNLRRGIRAADDWLSLAATPRPLGTNRELENGHNQPTG